MLTIESLVKVNEGLLPIEEFEGPIADPDYIEGAICLTIEHKPILRRELVDYVDQLWAYLVDGLGEMVAGREFSTGYPDMPIDIVLLPQGGIVNIAVRSKSHKWDADACAVITELVDTLAPAGTLFFERMRRLVPSHRAAYDRCIAALARLAESSNTLSR